MLYINADVVNGWIEESEEKASTLALNPPDSIEINGIIFNNITGEPIKIAHERRLDYIINYQSDRQARNGEYPVVQVVVSETLRKKAGRTIKTYSINKKETKLW